MNYWDKAEKQCESIPGNFGLGQAVQECPSAATESRKPSQTERAAEELAVQYNRIEALVAELERRISPVLRPELAGKGQTGEPPQPNGCAIATALRQQAASVRAVADRLDSIISRVDL